MNFSASRMAFGLLGAVLLAGLAPAAVAPAGAATFQQATIKRLVDGREVYINGSPAKAGETARSGQQLRTGKSRAELLFDNTATGFLGRSSVITLGNSCLRLSKGSVLVSGPQKACLGTKVLGVKGSTYLLALSGADTVSFIVFEGQGYVGPEDGPEEQQGAAAAGAVGDPSGNTAYVCKCEVARFTLDGTFIDQRKLSREEYESLLSNYTESLAGLPKSAAITDAINSCYGT